MTGANDQTADPNGGAALRMDVRRRLHNVIGKGLRFPFWPPEGAGSHPHPV